MKLKVDIIYDWKELNSNSIIEWLSPTDVVDIYVAYIFHELKGVWEKSTDDIKLKEESAYYLLELFSNKLALLVADEYHWLSEKLWKEDFIEDTMQAIKGKSKWFNFLKKYFGKD